MPHTTTTNLRLGSMAFLAGILTTLVTLVAMTWKSRPPLHEERLPEDDGEEMLGI